jgi:hypothetical protein
MAQAPPRDANGVGSNGAGILEGAGEHRAVRIERRLELFGGPSACPSAVLEVPTLGWGEDANVPLAQFARSRRAIGRRVEPNGEVARIEREGCRGRGAASGSRTMTSHSKTVVRARHCFVPG